MRVLFVKTSSLGDIIHAFPAAEYVKREIGADIDWVVEEEFADLLRAHPGISRVFSIHTRAWRRGKKLRKIYSFLSAMRQQKYDVIFDLQGNVKSALITMAARGKKKAGFGWKTVAEKPNLLATNFKVNPPSFLNVRSFNLHVIKNFFNKTDPCEDRPFFLRLGDEERLVVQRIVEESECSNTRTKIMICPFAFWKNKEMTQHALIQFLEKVYHSTPSFFFCIWGNTREKELCEAMGKHFEQSKIVEKLSLQALQHLIYQMDLVIAMDSMPLHLASTTTTPTFGIFGPSSSEYYAPARPGDGSYQGSCPYKKNFYKRCPILRKCPTGACIRSLEGSQVFAKFESESLLSLPKPDNLH